MKWTHKIGPRAYRFGTLAVWLVTLMLILPLTGVIEVALRKLPWGSVDARTATSIIHIVMVGAAFAGAFRLHYWLYVGRLNRLGIKVDPGTLSDFASGLLRRYPGRNTDAALIAREHARGRFTQAELDNVAEHLDREGWLAEPDKPQP